jgi:hypothetical protein
MMASSTPLSASRAPRPIPVERLQGLAYGRAAGLAVGCFLILWGPLSALRWEGHQPHGLLMAQGLFFTTFGLLLVLPWNRLPLCWWKPLFYLLCFFAAAFAFIQVIDLLFQYMVAAEFRRRPAPPAFQGIQLFLALLQPPVILFNRNPRLLD